MCIILCVAGNQAGYAQTGEVKMECECCGSTENLNVIETYTAAGEIVACDTCLDNGDIDIPDVYGD
ncbi:hypothetical protein KC887_04345 [Candidatus Kaiserbacteria bacterium]|nr:hypothetical protein [Candidatus Kaiserbacteria bacterium]